MASEQAATFFVVVGAQRTGTNLLREILNTNPGIAMLGEIFTPSSAPAHWDNFVATLPHSERSPATAHEVRQTLDRYLNFVNYRVRNFWIDGDKSGARAIGVDIKYNQLRSVAPSNWQCTAIPYLVDYLETARAVFVHVVRRNLIHCAISAMIAEQRNIWHNYQGVPIDRSFTIDPSACIDLARSITRDRDGFARCSTDAFVVECCYEDLVSSIERAGTKSLITFDEGPLPLISRALGVEFQFRYDGGLRKAINIPYPRLIANHRDLVAAVTHSEFAAFAPTLA
ncbi:MAG TPA: sulfotransferase [Terriglobales bacterium]|nr:sulfotransferase [Terriglobales bacterium]